MRQSHHAPHVSVRAYYEQTTRIFLLFNRGRTQRAIHRAIWAPGVTTTAQALSYINDLVGATIAQLIPSYPDEDCHILDLGCGVGGTVFHLAQSLAGKAQYLGISITPVQVRLAQATAIATNLQERCYFAEADYLHLPCTSHFDCAYAVESLIHAPDPAQAFKEAAAALKPGGYLLICDDFLSDAADPAHSHSSAQFWLTSFRRGWYANGLLSHTEALELAQQAGLQLITTQDLTPDLHLLPLPFWIGNLVLQLGRLIPLGWALPQSLVIGGLALQYCLRIGLLKYQWIVFQKHEM